MCDVYLMFDALFIGTVDCGCGRFKEKQALNCIPNINQINQRCCFVSHFVN